MLDVRLIRQLQTMLKKINNYCYAEGKFSKDIQRGEWQFETGISYVMCLPKTNEDTGESPLNSTY